MKKQAFLTLIFIQLLLVSFAIAQTQLGQDIIGDSLGVRSGHSVSLSANGCQLAIGTPAYFGGGLVRVYNYDGSDWNQIGNDILGTQSSERTGSAVALSGDGTIVAVTAIFNNNDFFRAGQLRIYKLRNGVWRILGNPINGKRELDDLGTAVSISTSGYRVAVSSNVIAGTEEPGYVEVYEYLNGDWELLGETITADHENDLFGFSISLSGNGNRLIVGAAQNDSAGTDSGHARVFEFQDGEWIQLGNDVDGIRSYTYFGRTVSISGEGERVAIGSLYNGLTIPFLNDAYSQVYEYIDNEWKQLGDDINDVNHLIDFGTVSLSNDGTRIAVLGQHEDTGNTHVRILEFVDNKWTLLGNEIISLYGSEALKLSRNGNTVAIGKPFVSEPEPHNSLTEVYGDFPPSQLPDTLQEDKTKYVLYPNPTTGLFSIQEFGSFSCNAKVFIYNSIGQLIKEDFAINHSLDISELPAGYYFVSIQKDENSYIYPIVKNWD